MTRLWRFLRWLLLAGGVLVVLLITPVAYVETTCRGTQRPDPYDALLPASQHRPESRTLMTYPEWHIVHAYDDYGRVLKQGDPHDFAYLRSIAGFWTSLCALTDTAAAHGGVDAGTKQMVYVIGTSFTLELALKAAYEETLGRVTTWLRGNQRAATDTLSADQAAAYANFLQQTPWYKWDFEADAAALRDAAGADTLRDQERQLALGLEYGAKAAYARLIAAAVAQSGGDALHLHMVVRDIPAAQLAALPGVTVEDKRPEGIVIRTPRYRALTELLIEMAEAGASFVEIAGNDDIMLTALSPEATYPDALHSFARQGADDYRHLIMVKVPELAARLRMLAAQGLRVEHVHDY